MDLADKRAIVLGGSSGIGLAVVQGLLVAGAQVTAAGRSHERLARAREAAPGARFESVDVLDRDALAALFVAAATPAPFDLLVCAATGGERAVGPFLQMDLDGFQGSFRKLWGYANAVRLGAPQMSASGSIVLVSGFPARRARPGMSAIATVGNAVEGFVRAIAPELAPLRINVVSPGVIDTPGVAALGADFLANATRANPIARAGTAEEVADAVLFLLRNDFATGTTVDVDGGAPLA